MIKKISIAIWLVAAFASCKEDQVIPRTNPRFSVAFVQTIDRSGAEFAANVYDLGAEEVLDYGFVYGTGIGLSINTNNFVSEKGSPGKEFRMKSDHSMPLGARIFVSAFIRTSEGVVYSQPYQFVSQGSDGFVFDRIEIPQEVYFGDTLIVFGSKLSRIPSDYRVFVQGKSAIVAKIQEGSFGIVIPRSITFQDGEGALQNVEFELKVSDKTLKVTKLVKFRQPEFVLERVQELGYTQDLVLVGDYLYDENLRVKYVNQQGENFNLTTKEVMDSRISIRLNALFTESNPKLQLSIRGQSYLIDGFLKLKETKINPDQTIEFRGFSGTATVKGENFNPFLAAYNSFRIKPDIFKIDILSVHDSELEISFEYSFDKGPGSRVSEFRMESAGITSSNPLKLEWTDPGIPFVLTNEYNQNYEEGRTVALGGKG